MDDPQRAQSSKAERPVQRWADFRVIGPLFIALMLGGIFFPRPKFVSGVTLVMSSVGRRPGAVVSEGTLALYSTLLILVPSVMFLIAMLAAKRSPRWIRRLRYAVRIFAAIAILDVPLSGVIAVFGTPAIVAIQAAVAVAIVSADLFFLRGFAALEQGQFRMSRKAVAFGIPAIAVATWSILNVPLVLVQAAHIAGDSPYCLVEFSVTSDSSLSSGYAPVNSLFDLRGTHLYTSVTGVKDSLPPPYFHAVLRVQNKDRREFWNWSITHARFETLSDAFFGIANFCDVDKHFAWLLLRR